MADFEFEIPMPEKYRKLILKLVDISKKQNVMSLSSIGLGHNSVQIGIGNEQWVEQIEGLPMETFDCLGFLEHLDYGQPGHTRHFILTPMAFKLARYQKKNRLMRWLARVPSNTRDIAIFIAFILSLGLSVLQILELVGVIKTATP